MKIRSHFGISKPFSLNGKPISWHTYLTFASNVLNAKSEPPFCWIFSFCHIADLCCQICSYYKKYVMSPRDSINVSMRANWQISLCVLQVMVMAVSLTCTIDHSVMAKAALHQVHLLGELKIHAGPLLTQCSLLCRPLLP